jgi:hypothetical protein
MTTRRTMTAGGGGSAATGSPVGSIGATAGVSTDIAAGTVGSACGSARIAHARGVAMMVAAITTSLASRNFFMAGSCD